MSYHNDESNSTDITRHRAIRLFTFLQELVQLRSKVVRWVDKYDTVLWMGNVPEAKGCYSIFRNYTDQLVESDIWLEVVAQSEENAPEAPASLSPWLKPSHINDPDRDAPELLKRIPNPRFENRTNRYETPEFLYIEEYRSDVLPQWKNYVSQLWRPWAKKARVNKRTKNIYNTLFSIYQRQQKLDESYEVVLGLGCLIWKTPGGNIVKRHLLTIPAHISFDTKRDAISVSGDSSGWQLEQEMLEILERPNSESLVKIEKRLANLDDQMINPEIVSSILQEWLQALPNHGKLIESLAADQPPENFPQVSLAPALILRKRTDRSMLNVFDEVVGQLKSGSPIPPGVVSLVQINEGENKEEKLPLYGYDPLIDGEIFFPKTANEEQQNIIRALNRQQGVVVQGPPGTGKSHTIANVISHLLASGKRVLVTSHTTRALRVLEKMIPQPLAALAIAVLDDDAESMQKLEYSAAGIIERYNYWEPERSRKLVKALRSKLADARRAEVRILRDMRSLRETETFEYLLVGEAYSGTLETIAKRLKFEAHLYKWFLDRPEKEELPPITDEEAQELIQLLRKVGPEEEKIVKMNAISPNELMSVHEFNKLQNAENRAKQRYERFYDVRTSAEYSGFSEQPEKVRQRFLILIDKILDTYHSLDHHAYAWVKKACSQILAGRVSAWQTLLGLTEKEIKFLKENIDKIKTVRITGIEGRDLRTVKEHAQQLYHHLLSQGKVGFGPFRPKVVRDALYLIKLVSIDGAPCDNLEKLRVLLDYIEIADRFETLNNHWSQHTDVPTGAPFSIQLAEYESLFAPLSRTLELHECAMELREIINSHPGIFEPNWHDIESIRHAKQVVIAKEAEAQIEQIRVPFDQLEQQLSDLSVDSQTHPIIDKLLIAVRNRDEKAYHHELKHLHILYKLRDLYERRNGLLNKLVNTTPKVLKSILLTYNDAIWDERLINFTDAWNWACAEAWLRRAHAQTRQERLELEHEVLQDTIKELVMKLAIAEAWDQCFSRMTEHERQHLMAWTKAIQRLGKGTGKYAHQHRKAAREHSEACKTVIPAWIMPVYRVAETLRPAPGMFDVAIIDEASQSGPEALFLMYIAKKVIVVGDNHQISPDFIGINREDIDHLRRKYLEDIPHSDLIGVDNSFFDQSEVRFGNPIRLREHFRCMPEIIEFSNRLCYKTEPLVPLRQFSQTRLNPVMSAEYLGDGYTKGSGSKIVNPVEAEAIVKKIKTCCKNTAYSGKTMGVISLQGSAQARFIEKLLIKELGPAAMENRNLICGDAYTFQGDERDVMFLSMVTAPDRRIGTLSNAKDKRRFNVAVSRAKDQVWLFHSVKLSELPTNGLRHTLLSYFQNPAVPMRNIAPLNIERIQTLAAEKSRGDTPPPPPFNNWFEIDIFLKLKAKGYRVIPKFEIDHFSIDLVVEGLNGRLGIECYGAVWNGIEEFEQDMARQRMLERCGWQFLRIRGSEYYRYPEKTMENLLGKLTEMSIQPITREPNGNVRNGNGIAEVLKALPEMN